MKRLFKISKDKKTGKMQANIKEPVSALGDYIRASLKRYSEPQRRGTPKGDKIGFSRQKYYASLLVGLTNFKLKKIAKWVDVSYGMLRVWNTEDDFKTLADDHAKEFAVILCSVILDSVKQFKDLWDEYLNVDKDIFDVRLKTVESVYRCVTAFSDKVVIYWLGPNKIDGSTYGLDGLTDAFEVATIKFKHELDQDSFNSYMSVCSALYGFRLVGEPFVRLMQVGWSIKNLKYVTDIIAKKDPISKEDKKTMTYLLSETITSILEPEYEKLCQEVMRRRIPIPNR